MSALSVRVIGRRPTWNDSKLANQSNKCGFQYLFEWLKNQQVLYRTWEHEASFYNCDTAMQEVDMFDALYPNGDEYIDLRNDASKDFDYQLWKNIHDNRPLPRSIDLYSDDRESS